jgi:murein DD-endopeptidase MepM/ murein hydrolase activator NlpD
MALALPLRATPTQPRAYWLSQPYHNGIWYNPFPHHALDMVGYNGQPVYAADSGRIFAADWGGGGWAIGGGWTVIIDHYGEGNRFAKTGYAHMARVVVSKNQFVMRGQLIGYADSTGNSTGHHLHFSVGEARMGTDPRWYNNWFWPDPRRYLRAHTFANGSQGNGDRIGSWHLGRNTWRVNANVNLRSGATLTSPVVRTTTAATQTGFVRDVLGATWSGSRKWMRVYDPVTRREVYAHSLLGVWIT